jgi:hypothetical protein
MIAVSYRQVHLRTPSNVPPPIAGSVNHVNGSTLILHRPILSAHPCYNRVRYLKVPIRCKAEQELYNYRPRRDAMLNESCIMCHFSNKTVSLS